MKQNVGAIFVSCKRLNLADLLTSDKKVKSTETQTDTLHESDPTRGFRIKPNCTTGTGVISSSTLTALPFFAPLAAISAFYYSAGTSVCLAT